MIMGLDVVVAKGLDHVAGVNFASDWVNLFALAVSLQSTTCVQFASTFEYAIRYLGGLLSAHALSGQDVLLEKALQIGERLLPAFGSPSGIPFGNGR
jgi:hypothetical protein